MSDTVIDLLKTGYPVLTLLYNVIYFSKKRKKKEKKAREYRQFIFKLSRAACFRISLISFITLFHMEIL